MKHIISLILLISASTQAQEENEAQTNQNETKKRPSWSQGLPERKKAPTFNQPALKTENSNTEINSRQLEIETPNIGSYTSEKPKFDLEEIERPDFDYKIEPEVIDTKETITEQPIIGQSVRLDKVAKQRNRSNKGKTTNPLHAQYKWNVVSTTPIDLPSHLSSHDSISVNIYIKPDGSVSKVTSSDPNVSSLALSYVSSSIQNWLFEAPSTLGITDVMSKSFAIEIKS